MLYLDSVTTLLTAVTYRRVGPARLWLTAAFASLLALSSAGSARAQAATEHAHDPDYRPENGYWSEGVPRLFVSTKSALGAIYTKPYFSLGYGLPHWIWAGIDVNAIITTSVAEVFAGARLSSPIFDLSFGIRDNWSFDKPFLMPRDSFNYAQVVDAPGSKARYWALESEAVAILPLPHAALVANFVMVNLLDLPDNMYLYEESYRLITKNPTFYVMRVAALARFLHENSLKAGILAEYGFSTGRDKGVLRMGPIVSLQLTDHLSLNLGVTLKVSSPDHLGIALGAYGLAGFRYQWATGERRPELPWQGDLIPLGISH